MSGVVWTDDGDGVRGEQEPVTAGVQVGLYSLNRVRVSETVTSEDGRYFFEAEPGTYRISIEAPSQHGFTVPRAGDDATRDSDVVETETRSEDGVETHIGWTAPVELDAEVAPGAADAGLVVVPPVVEPTTVMVSGVVWADDGDGVRLDTDSEVDPPVVGEERIADVRVSLYQDRTAGPVAEAITDADGAFVFETVAGSYWLGFLAPEGHTFVDANLGDDTALDSDVTEVTDEGAAGRIVGWAPVEVTESDDTATADAGLVPMRLPPEEPPPVDEPPEDPEPTTATVAGVIWHDDGDGIRVDPPLEDGSGGDESEPEPRAAAVKVSLYEADGTTLVSTVSTDGDGLYEFTDVPVGRYLIQVEAPSGHMFTIASVGDDETIDSDITRIEELSHGEDVVELLGWTSELEVSVDTQPGLVDAGFVPLPPAEEEELPPAEDPGEVAVEPPEVGGSREDDPAGDPREPDDPAPDDDEQPAAATDDVAGEREDADG